MTETLLTETLSLNLSSRIKLPLDGINGTRNLCKLQQVSYYVPLTRLYTWIGSQTSYEQACMPFSVRICTPG